MEGTPSGQGRVLKVEREYACSRIEGKLLAMAYEEVVPLLRRQRVAGRSYEPEAVDRRRHWATVGA